MHIVTLAVLCKDTAYTAMLLKYFVATHVHQTYVCQSFPFFILLSFLCDVV